MEDKLNNILVVIESIDVDDSSGTKGRVALMQSLAKIGYAITAVHFTQKDIKIPGIECLAVNERKDNVLYLLSRLHRVLFRWFKIDIGKYIDQKIGFSFGFFNDARSIKKAIATYKPESFDMVWTLSKGNSKSLIVPHQFPEETTENIILPDFFEEEKFNLLHAGNLKIHPLCCG